MIKLNTVEEYKNIITYVYHKYYPRTGGNTSPIKCLNGDLKQFKIESTKNGWEYTEYVNNQPTGRVYTGDFRTIAAEFWKMGYYLTNGLGNFYRKHKDGDEYLTVEQRKLREAY